MNTVSLKLSIKPTDRYVTYLKIVSSVLPEPLTESEIEVLNAFHKLSGGVVDTATRKEVCLMLKITNLNLNNFLTKVRKKGFIAVKDGEEMIVDNFNIDTAEQEKILGLAIQMIARA